MRRRLLAAALFCLLLATAAWAGAKFASPRVFVNGLPLRESALVQNGVTYVPLRAVAEALDCEVRYDPKTGVQVWSSINPLPTDPGGPVVPDPYPHVPVPQVPSPGAPRPARVPVP